MITIDGSTLEGGGQLTRLALSLSAITNQPVRIHSIRAGRSSRRNQGPSSSSTTNKSKPKPSNHSRPRTQPTSSAGGLKDSHLAALNFLASQTNAKVTGAEVGSSEVIFKPRLSRPLGTHLPERTHRFHTISLQKPGSVWLIFQAIYPYLVFTIDWAALAAQQGSIQLTLRGGTHVPKAMSTEYMTQIFSPTAEKLGLPRLDVSTTRQGWAGHAPEIGEVVVTLHPPPQAPSPFTVGAFTLSAPTSRTPTRIDATVHTHTSFHEPLSSTLTAHLAAAFPSTTVALHPSSTPTTSPGGGHYRSAGHT